VKAIMSWVPFDGGATVGQRGSEEGVIVRDEEHELGARIALERDCGSVPFTITCGIYGWFFHTRFFGKELDGATEFARMQAGLTSILAGIPRRDDPEADAKCARLCEEIADFVSRFP
jgi:hypothetical protein